MDIDWTPAVWHMWERHAVPLRAAIEAALDQRALVLDPDPASISGSSLRIVGYSPSARCVIVVVVVRDGGHYRAATAWFANASWSARYREGGHADEPEVR